MAVFADLLGDRRYIDQYEIGTAGFVVHVNGVPTDADADAVTLTIKDLDDPPNTLFGPLVVTEHPAIGIYEFDLQSVHTATPGVYQLQWDYEIAGVPQQFISLVEVGFSSPAYTALSEEMRGLVELVWLRFADLFDSPYGGPHLQVYFQSRFNRNTMAQLLRVAVGVLNTAAQPRTVYTVEDGAPHPFPLAEWGPLLEKSLYMEAIKHLMRSYVEQPLEQNVTVARLDRRDYLDRWRQVYDIEKAEFDQQFENFKILHMGLGRPRVLVSGGVYGTYGPTRLSHSAAARPRYWFAFH